MWRDGQIMPRLPWVEVHRHIYRGFNAGSLAAAIEARQHQADFSRTMPGDRKSPPKYIRICTDGSLKDGHAAAGWIVFCAWEDDEVKCCRRRLAWHATAAQLSELMLSLCPDGKSGALEDDTWVTTRL